MEFIDYLILAGILLILSLAALYVYKTKKKGGKCIGCPDGKRCSGNCPGCDKKA